MRVRIFYLSVPAAFCFNSLFARRPFGQKNIRFDKFSTLHYRVLTNAYYTGKPEKIKYFF